MSGVIRWEEPPGRGRPGGAEAARAPDVWRAIADELRANPGRWALVRENVKPNSLNAYTHLIKRGGLAGFGPGFEAVQRSGSLYARYVGETPPP